MVIIGLLLFVFFLFYTSRLLFSQQLIAWTNPTHAPVSCPCCVTGVCARVSQGGGVCLAGTFTWTEGRQEVMVRLQGEGRELVAEGGKQIFVNTSSDV